MALRRWTRHGSYQPGGEVTGSVAPPPPPPPSWTWDGGTAVTVRPGQTVESIAHEHGVPVTTLREANHIAVGASVYPGQHLVIPRYRPATAAEMPPPARVASSPPAVTAPYVPPRGGLVAPSGSHVVAPGETLNSIGASTASRFMVIARANNIPPDTMVRVGERIVIPEMGGRPAPVAPRAEAPVAAPTTVATIESPHSARLATPSAPVEADNPIKAEKPPAPCRLSLAGSWPHHRPFGPEAQRLAERRHQPRGAGRHAGQGGRGRRGRLCRQ